MTTFIAWIVAIALAVAFTLLAVTLIVLVARRHSGFHKFYFRWPKRLFRLSPGRVPMAPPLRGINMRERKRVRAEAQRADTKPSLNPPGER